MNKPKIQIKFQNEQLKVFEISGMKGDHLDSHKVDKDAILQINSGEVTFKHNKGNLRLKENDFHLIAADLVHNLQFESNAFATLILMANAKMKFTEG